MAGNFLPVRHGCIEVQLFRAFVRQRDHLAADGWQALALSSRLHRSAALPHFRAAVRPSRSRWLAGSCPVVTAASKCSSSALSCGSETIYCCGDYILSFHKCQIQFTSSALISIWHTFSFILIAVSRRKFSNWQFHHHWVYVLGCLAQQETKRYR